MINNHISTKHLLVSTIDYFNIHSSDIISKIYDWTFEGLGELSIYSSLISCTIDATLVDYRCSLPCNIKVLNGITHNNIRLTPSKSIRLYDTSILNEYPESTNTYEHLPNGVIQTTIKEDTIQIHYMTVPTEYDNELEVNVPLVPDNEYVLKALRYYLLMRLMLRGYAHPTLKLDDVMQSWEHNKMVAQNKAIRLDPDTRERLRLAWGSMVINPKAWENALYKKV